MTLFNVARFCVAPFAGDFAVALLLGVEAGFFGWVAVTIFHPHFHRPGDADLQKNKPCPLPIVPPLDDAKSRTTANYFPGQAQLFG